jgi:hypothetical protein
MRDVNTDNLSDMLYKAYYKSPTFEVFEMYMEKLCDWESLSYFDIWMMIWKCLNNHFAKKVS